jgi:tRNA A37 threonylcarbamoyladenosine modification protein TsaB
LAIGDGALRYAGLLAEVTHVEVGTVGSAYPSAAVLVELAQPLAQHEQFVPPAEIGPLYLRQADVRIHWETRDQHLVHDQLAGQGDVGRGER